MIVNELCINQKIHLIELYLAASYAIWINERFPNKNAIIINDEVTNSDTIAKYTFNQVILNFKVKKL